MNKKSENGCVEFPQVSSSFLGRLAKVKCPTTKPLLPLYEAVSNSLDAIDTYSIGDEVKIVVLRDNSRQALNEDRTVNNVVGFEVIDNGIGLDDVNFNSFCKTDSTHKIAIGGKGIGRLTWLKVFDYVNISSTYQNSHGYMTRRMELQEAEQPFKSYSNVSTKNAFHETRVTLKWFKGKYIDGVDKTTKTIADKIVCHFIPRLLNSNRISLRLEDGEEIIDLNSFFTEHYSMGIYKETFALNGYDFSFCIIPTNSARDNNNRVHYCANLRNVLSKKIDSFNRYVSRAGLYYAGYLTSDYLDAKVNDDRCSFAINDLSNSMLDEVVGWNDIDNVISRIIKSFLGDKTSAVEQEHKSSIDKYVRDKNPRYRALLASRPELVDKVPLAASEDEIVSVLEVENQRQRLLLKRDISQTIKGTGLSLDAKKSEIFKLIKSTYETGKDILADYMIERRAVLDLLKAIISQKEDGTPYLEADVHNLVFPMGKTSDEINYDEHNLWILDERMAFHRHLTSDLSITSSFENDSRKEPDILYYVEEPGNVHNNFSSATIVEFKRPLIPGKHKDPIDQINEIVFDLREGNKTIDGRKIKFRTGSHFYGFIVTEINDHLKKSIAIKGNFTLTPDGDGYFGYNPALNLYTEIISFDKLLNDAEKRNQILFQQLGM